MEREFIVVFGGTGTIGKHLVPLLCKKLASLNTDDNVQHVVCVITRNIRSAIEIFMNVGLIPLGSVQSSANSFPIAPHVGLGFVEGSVEYPELLEDTLHAATRLFLLTQTSFGPRQRVVEENILSLMNREDHPFVSLRHIVRISAHSRYMSGQPSNSPFRWHSECDDQLLQWCAIAQASGRDVSVSVIRPSLFMQDMIRPHFAPVICRTDCFYQLGKLCNTGSVAAHGVYQDLYRIAMVDVRDIAEVCACVLTESVHKHAGHTYLLCGPRALSWGDVAAAISSACGRPITASMLSDRAFLDHFGGSHIYLKQMQAYRAGGGEDVDNDCEVVTGRPPRDITEFASDYVEAWRKDDV